MTKKDLTSTEQLLLACANPLSNGAGIEELLQADIDWSAFLDMAKTHRLLPLIRRSFEVIPDTGAPDEVTAAADKAYLSSVVRIEFLESKMRLISDQFEDADIRAIPWKGPDLAGKVYFDPALRPADDLDYLVHPDDLLKAADVLASMGLTPKLTITNSVLSRYLAAGHEYIMASEDGDLHVELATRPVPPPSPLDGRLLAIWENEGGVLSPERYFTYLCMHGARHCWDRLIWVSDLCAFLHRYDQLKWNKVKRFVRDMRAETMMLSALDMIACVGYGPPDITLAARRIPSRRLLRNAFDAGRISKFVQATRRSAMHSRAVDRLRYIWCWLFAPTFSDWNALDLRRGFSWLYWILRPFRIAASRLRSSLRPRIPEPPRKNK